MVCLLQAKHIADRGCDGKAPNKQARHRHGRGALPERYAGNLFSFLSREVTMERFTAWLQALVDWIEALVPDDPPNEPDYSI
jgi:hypothetical protein